MNVDTLALVAFLLLSCEAVMATSLNEITRVQFSELIDEFGIVITAMKRHFNLVANFLDQLDVSPCFNQKSVVYLSTDSPDYFRDTLNMDTRNFFLVFRSITDMGDRINCLHRFHHLLEHEPAIATRRTKALVSVQIGLGSENILSQDIPISSWLCHRMNRSRPLITWCCPEQKNCCDHWTAADTPLNIPPCTLYSSVVAGYTSAMLDMAAAIRGSIEFEHSRHQLAPSMDAHHVAAYAAKNSARFQLLPAAPCAHSPRSVAPTQSVPHHLADGGLVTAIGYPGRLGNWLFRAAVAMAVAWDTGRHAVLPEAVPCMAEAAGAPPPPPCTFLGSFLSGIERVPDLDGAPAGPCRSRRL